MDPALLRVLTAAHRDSVLHASDVTPERFFAYVYGVLAGGDYTERFAVALETPGPRVPLTGDPELFARMADLGEELLWLQTFGSRFRSSRRQELPRSARIAWTTKVSRLPADLSEVHHDSDRSELHVADGVLTGVGRDVWEFQVSGMQVIKKWLGYRTARASGRAGSSTSPLDAIRPATWLPAWSHELRDLVDVLTRTVDTLPRGTELLERICAGPLVPASDLPSVPARLRQPPTGSRGPRQAMLPED